MEKKTGTTTVGIKAKDGVVLAADTQASLDHMVETMNIKKILPDNFNLSLGRMNPRLFKTFFGCLA